MNKIIFIIHCLVFLFLQGCYSSPLPDITKGMEPRTYNPIDSTKPYDESKIIYVKERRCFVYLAGVPEQSENDENIIAHRIIYDETGRKIMTRDAAIAQIKYSYNYWESLSNTEKTAAISSTGWVAITASPLIYVGLIAWVPAYPGIYHFIHKAQKESFENYNEGLKLMKLGQYSEAREKFQTAIRHDPLTANQSDIYFKLADSYNMENIKESSAKYYERFIEYSVALYPGYFKEYDSKFVNDLAELDKEFTIAEDKLGALRRECITTLNEDDH